MNPSHPLTRDVIARVFFFSAFALILYQLFLLAEPFFTATLGAVMLTVMFFPLHRRIVKSVKNSTVSSIISTGSVLLLAVLPLVGLGWFFIRESAELAPTAQHFMEDIHSRDWSALASHLPAFLQHALDYVSSLFIHMDVDVNKVLLDHAQLIGAHVTGWASQALRNIFVMIMNALILAVVLFFAFRDGEALWHWILSIVPMPNAHKHIVEKRVYETFRAVVIGSFLTAAAQGVTAMVGFLIAGVRLPVILGIATSVASMLGGSFIVTLPVAFYVMRESVPWGIFLLIWAGLVIGLLDNFLKPVLIGSRAKMPFILIFFSIVGGIKLYGLLGFILGPVLVAGFLSFVKIYQEEYN